MMVLMDIWFFIAAFLAEVVGTVAGFGSALILLPVALLFMDFKTALVLVAFVHMFGSVARITFLHKRIAWRMVTHFSWIGIGAGIAGALLVVRIDPALLQAFLGVFLIAYSIFMLCKPRFRLKPTTGTMLVGGATSGFLTGLLGTGGALRSAFLSSFGLIKEKYVATAAAIAIIVDSVRLPVYLRDGLLSSDYYWMLPILLVLAVAGAYVGKGFVRKIPQSAFNKLVLLCLFAAGIKFAADYIVHL